MKISITTSDGTTVSAEKDVEHVAHVGELIRAALLAAQFHPDLVDRVLNIDYIEREVYGVGR